VSPADLNGEQHLLSVERLHVRYGAVTALRDITVTVGAKEALRWSRERRRKSTLFCRSWVSQARRGRISFAGKSLARLPPGARPSVSATVPRGGGCPGLTVRENLEVAHRPAKSRPALVDSRL
jgi:ABC-type branched-subunit amino acid transport system ATPase component